MQNICLTQIVKNEERVLARCLRAAKPAITHWSIVDTGSTDRTREIIAEELADIPGKLHERPWVNFGHNRTESFELARETLWDLGVPWERTYCLLLDADHELDATRPLPELTHAGYSLAQIDQAISYTNTRLIRADSDWRCVGPTHEYWTCDGAVTADLDQWFINDHTDGARTGKWERDEQLLTAYLLEHPDDPRTLFYLGQTLQDLKRWDEAIEYYARRAAIRPAFEEERWMAQLRIGRCHLFAGRHELGVAALLQAFNERPGRAEPLYYLAHHYRERGLNALAEMFATRAAAVPFPGKDTLFVEHPIYHHGIDEELAISSFYVGKNVHGLDATERLLEQTQQHVVASQNLPFYATKLQGMRGTFDVPEALRTFDGTLYHCSNPSVCGDVVNVRLVNYEQQCGRRYWGRPDPMRIITRNAIHVPGRAWNLLDESILKDWNQDTRIFGLEDMRLVRFQDRVWFSATTCQVPDANGEPQVVFGRLDEKLESIEHLDTIGYFFRGPVEKNWILWPDGDRLRCVYSFSPLVILDIEPKNGRVLHHTTGKSWSYPGRFRGSAGPIALEDGGALFMVHDVARQEHENVYTHRFVLVKDDELDSFGPPLLLEHWGIEYACGLGRVENDLIITYGMEDREAKWLRIPAAEVVL